MTDPITLAMNEHLKRFQVTLERVESKTNELIVRMGHLEVATAAIKRARENENRVKNENV